MTISDQLIDINNSKLAIKSAIETKGQVVGTIPFSQYAAKILDIQTGAPKSVSPVITSQPVMYYEGTFSINVNDFQDTAFNFEVRDNLGNVVITDSQVTFSITAGSASFPVSGFTPFQDYHIYAYAQTYSFSPSDPAIFTFQISNETTYRYWRLTNFVVSGNTTVELDRLTFYSAPGATGTAYPPTMTSNTAPAPYVVTRSYIYNATYDSWKVFDNAGGYWWLLSRNPAQQLTDWVQIDLSEPVNIRSVRVNFRNLNCRESKLYASNTGEFTGEQVLLHTFGNVTSSIAG